MCKLDISLFVSIIDYVKLYVLIYRDDILITGSSQQLLVLSYLIFFRPLLSRFLEILIIFLEWKLAMSYMVLFYLNNDIQ